MARLIVAISVFIGVIALILSVINDVPFNGDEIDLSVTKYDAEALKAPVLTGNALLAFSWVSTSTPIGKVILRFLLNDNKLHLVRSFSSKFPHLSPLYYPMARLNKKDYEKQVALAKASSPEKVLAKGFGTKSKRKGFHFHSVEDYFELYKSGASTPSEIIDKVITYGMELDKSNKMFSSINVEMAMAQAKLSDERWKAGKPLSVFDGVPVAVKDMVDVKGHIIYDGAAKGIQATRDDTIVQRFRDAGAIVIGLTVMTEGGVTPLGYNVFFRGPFNPYAKDLDHYSGGSSSGSAVAVATGICPVTIGFDGGGSIRLPSSLSGIFGLASTFGRVPFDGGNTAFTTIKAGPMTSTARDAALAHALIARPPPEDHFYSQLYSGGHTPLPPNHLHGFMDIDDLSGVRIGIHWDYFADSDDEILSRCDQAVSFLKSRGATIVNITIPYIKVLRLAHALKIMSEFALSRDLKMYKGVEMEPNTRITVALGKTLTAGEVIAAERIKAWTFQHVKKMFKDSRLDLVMSPTAGILTPKISPAAKVAGENNNPLIYQLLKYIFLANLIGLPAMSVPVGYASDGLPIGVQLMGDHWNEHKLLRIANALEEGYLRREKPHHFKDVFE